MAFEVLDPTHEAAPLRFELPIRPRSLVGATVGFVSNGKEGTRGFFAHLEQMLKTRFEVGAVALRTKSNYSAPAEASIIAEASGWDLAITGLGD